MYILVVLIDVNTRFEDKKLFILRKIVWFMNETNENLDPDRDRLFRIVRFSLFFRVLMVFWYGLDIAGGF